MVLIKLKQCLGLEEHRKDVETIKLIQELVAFGSSLIVYSVGGITLSRWDDETRIKVATPYGEVEAFKGGHWPHGRMPKLVELLKKELEKNKAAELMRETEREEKTTTAVAFLNSIFG